MAKFEIGEIALVLRGDDFTKPEISECEIVGFSDEIGFNYLINVPGFPADDGKPWHVKEYLLRKKKPPQFERGSWNADVFHQLGWNPTKIGCEQ